MPEMPRLWKVGELTTRTGLTVRTLHHSGAMGPLSWMAGSDVSATLTAGNPVQLGSRTARAVVNLR